MVPTHLIFMHMNPVVAKESATVLTRLQNPFIRFMDFTLAAAVLYHGAYGLTSIANDYIVNRTLRRLVASIAIVAAITLSVLSLRLLVF
jgi:succinate dehydrogenase hydrophobic anchor subunit